MTKLQPKRRYGIQGLLLLVSTMLTLPASALEMEFMDGDITLSVSHSLTVGANWALKEGSDKVIYQGDPEICAGRETNCGNGGKNSGPNDSEAHTMYDKGVWSSQFKGTTDIEATWGDFGAFTRLLYFYDHEIMNQPRESRPTTFTGKQFAKWEFDDSAKKEIGRDIRALDYYLSWETYVFDKPLSVKVGNQVINWGQSTFLPGIGLTNPVDLVRLFSPGFELRELFKPVKMAHMSFGLSENINLEAYYQFAWEPINLPPGGSFMSVNNYTGEGVNNQGLGFVCLDGSPIATASPDEGGWCIGASELGKPDDGDEMGFRFTWTVPWLNYTQFDFYAIRYHNRLPQVGAIRAGILPNANPLCDALNPLAETTPVVQALAPILDGLAPVLGTVVDPLTGALSPVTGPLADGLVTLANALIDPLDQNAPGPIATTTDPNTGESSVGLTSVLSTAFTAAGGVLNGDLDAAGLTTLITNCLAEPEFNGYRNDTAPDAQNPAGIGNANANVRYEEDLWAYGFSWAGNLPGGWSFQGEMSLKKDLPIQYALPELISAAVWVDLDGAGGTFEPCSLRELDTESECRGTDLSALIGGPGAAAGLPHHLVCDPSENPDYADLCDPNTAVNPGYNMLAPGVGTKIGGVDYRDVFQAQFTLIKLFPQMFGGDTLTFVLETIYNKVIDMPEAPASNFVFNPAANGGAGANEATTGGPQFEKSDFTDFNSNSPADDWGWGYRLLLTNEYSGLFGTNWNFKPLLAWFHDVKGSQPSNIGTFLEGRRQMIFAGIFEWNQYKVIGKYAYFGGAKCCNIWQDRDSVSLTFQMGI